MTDIEPLLTVRDIAERLHISFATAYALIKQGAIASVRVGTGRGAIRIQLSALARYLNNATEAVIVVSSTETCRPKRTPLKHIRLQ